jgi:tRNA (Thr-GGU) A37 N-methylase
VNPADAPRQGDEGAPDAWLVFDERVGAALGDLQVGTDARADLARPNPIGLHRVQVLAIEGLRIRVAHLEAVDGTPVLDVKPVLGSTDER